MHCVFISRDHRHASAPAPAPVPVPKPVVRPLAEWPIWAKAIALLKKETDRGLGDTVVHVIGETNSERFKTWFQQNFKRSCGCTERQRWLNQRFAY